LLKAVFFTLLLPVQSWAQRVDDFSLPDQQGQAHQLSDYSDSDLVVLVIHRTGDLVSDLAAEDLLALRQQFGRRGVDFLLLNASDTREVVASHVQANAIDFTVLVDEQGSASNALGLTVTGESLVIDAKIMEILYRGPFNDRVNSAGSDSQGRNRYLRDALNNILLGSTADFEVPPLRGTPIDESANGSAATMTDTRIQEFTIAVPDQAITDLRTRLALTRLPDQIDGTSWEYGTDSGFLRELLAYWQNDFDWRRQERQLNGFDQFKTTIEGLDIHFIHQRSANPDAIPLLLVHGWPGSIAEFYKIIGPLTDPVAHGGQAGDAFHVIAPSLPGFGFSDKPNQPGYSPEKIAHVLAALMERLGYERYGLQGGDWGAIINRYIAWNYPQRLIGLHSNFVLAGNVGDDAPATPEELQKRTAREAYMANETGYQQIQGTKPQTLGYGLNDSPAGLAAWIVEKFHGWSDIPQDQRGALLDKFTMDELLTNISIYWFTGSITSSARIYYENRNAPRLGSPIGYVEVPTAGAIFPAEIYLTPRGWAERSYNIVRWTEMPRGGHFAALEETDLLLNDVRAFYRELR
jgi:pimeloyl-ACP methyl ester carboxylesterase/peroxiredoxin